MSDLDTSDRVIPRLLIAELQRWTTLAPADDWGDTVKADMARWILNQITDEDPGQTLAEAEASYQAEIGRLREDFSARRLQLMNHIADGEADRDVLAARLAAAETVVDAAQAWRPFAPMPRTRATAELIAAVDAYRAIQ